MNKVQPSVALSPTPAMPPRTDALYCRFRLDAPIDFNAGSAEMSAARRVMICAPYPREPVPTAS